MARIVSIHSFRGGTGKSNATANVAAVLARGGERVGVVDADIPSPGVHVLFGLDETRTRLTLNDFLWGKCAIAEAAYDVTSKLGDGSQGRLFLVPASIKVNEMTRMLHEGYDVATLNDGLEALLDDLTLDTLIIDTHPGLNEETLLSIGISDALAIVLRPDQQDYQGTSVTVDVARKLGVAKMLLVVNKVPAALDPAEIRRRVEEAYQAKVGAVLPHAEEMMALGSAGLFVLRYPTHAVTAQYRQLAAALTGNGSVLR